MECLSMIECIRIEYSVLVCTYMRLFFIHLYLDRSFEVPVCYFMNDDVLMRK
jgi:hypothetical protein